MLQNLRIVHKKRQNRCPRSSVEAGQKCVEIWRNMKEQHFSRLRKIGATLHQLWNLRKESLLWTPVRQCTWPAKRTWVKLKWILWRSHVVLRQSKPPMVKCKRNKRQFCMSENWMFFDNESLREHISSSMLGKLCDENGCSYEWINGQKPHLKKKGIRIICNTENFVPILVPGLSKSSSGSSSTSKTPSRQEGQSSSSTSASPSSPTVDEIPVREREDPPDSDISPVPVSNSVDDKSGQPDETQANQKFPEPNEKETTTERGDPLCSDDSEIPEWLQEFRENLVDDEIPLQGGPHASSSHEASLEPTTKRREDLGKHFVHTHFPKDRNCEICKRTKITRAPCRRRKGEAVPRADNFGDLITANHKVLSNNCESRNNHRYAVVVQDLVTQCIQAYPFKNKTSQET